ncbi:MAG: helix-turn-helix domain-containing protein [Geodermatophilaceae bacterium]
MAVFRWRLRMAAAQREVWTGAQLRRLLADKAGLDLSAASVSALLTRQPAQVKLDTLAALCAALECTPNDLLELDTSSEASRRSASPERMPSREGDQSVRPAAGAARAGGRRTPPPF